MKGTDYKISVSDAISGNTKEYTGSRYRVISAGKSYNKVLSLDYYPQFIADHDIVLANNLFGDFRGFGMNPGVNKWIVSKVVDSNT